MKRAIKLMNQDIDSAPTPLKKQATIDYVKKLEAIEQRVSTVIVDFDTKTSFDHKTFSKAAIYTRVSSAENRSDLDSQAERLCQYSIAFGYQVVHIVKEVGSGLNDHRKKLENLLTLDDYNPLDC